MTRIITIIAVLLAGMVGLLMSVCGGFFFFASAFQGLTSLFHGNNPGTTGPQSWALLLIAAVFMILGGTVFIACCRVIWTRLSGRE